MALMYVYRNLCWIQRNMRVTAAMAAGVTDHVWDLGELMTTALAEPAGEKPMPKPLVIPMPAGTSRELPSGRGFLRVVQGGDKPAAPSPGPVPPPVAPVAKVAASVASVVSSPAVDVNGQLDLLAWKAPPPKPRRYAQLDLFGIEIDPKGGDLLP